MWRLSKRCRIAAATHQTTVCRIQTRRIRLLQLGANNGLTLTDNLSHKVPPYAILSHTWGRDGDEVTFQDLIGKTGAHKIGFQKIVLCGQQAQRDGLEYFWVDTCCIDKTSSAELTEAINSMFHWYQKAERCYAYLEDVVKDSNPSADELPRPSWPEFRESRWFTRGWTLQELVAPSAVDFFSSEWQRLGNKQSLEQDLCDITGISVNALRGERLSDISVIERMSWLKNRQTKLPEDMAYCMLGIFDVYMPLIYGEKDNAFRRLQEEIDKHSKDSVKEIHPDPSAVIPFSRDVDFVERRNVLDQIYQKCAEPGSRVALVGLGGTGKSQLAIEYAYRTRERSPDTWVFWVHASNAARFEQSFRDIAGSLQLPGRENKEADIFQMVHDWLRNGNSKWVIILDNVDDADFLFESRTINFAGPANAADRGTLQLVSYLPQCPNGSMLITSRSTGAVRKLVEDRDVIAIEPMNKDEAVMLLRKKLGTRQDYDSVSDLAITLEYMPLAIVQAAAYISQRAPRYSISQYLDEFRHSDRKKESLLNREAGALRRDREAKNSIIITWQISFEHIQKMRPSAAELLALMSFFDRQGIPDVLLRDRDEVPHQDAKETSDDNRRPERYKSSNDNGDGDQDTSRAGISDTFEDDIITLRDYSFISTSEDGATFELHGLVQIAIRKWITEHGQLERWKKQFIKNLNSEFPNSNHENWPKCQLFFPHVVVAVRQKPKDNDSLHDWASILYKAAAYAWQIGNWVSAEEMSAHSMNIRKQMLGSMHKDTLASMAITGLSLQLRGHLKAAEALQAQVVKISKEKLGEDHLDTLTTMNNLAITFSKQGRWEEAEELGLQVLEISKRKLGNDHPGTLTSMSNLALTFWNQGRWNEAEELGLQILEIRKNKFDNDHPNTVASMGNLASTFLEQGRWGEAKELGLQVLEISKRKLGNDHPSTLTSMNNLASTLSKQGRLQEAEELGLQVLEISKRKLGNDHPDTLIIMNNLAITFSKQGRWEEAEELGLQVIEASKRKLGEDHPDTLTSMNSLATTFSKQGRLDEAEELGLQVLEIRKNKLGDDHPDTIVSMGNLAITFLKQGRLGEAEELGLQVLEINKNKLGDDHPDTMTSMDTLALTFWHQGRWREAEELGLQVLEIRKNKLGNDHPNTLISMNNLASTFSKQGRWEEAQELGLQVLEANKTKLGEDHPDTLTSMGNLASTFSEQGRWEEAEKLGSQLLSIRKNKLGNDHPDTLNSMGNLALIFSKQGRWEEAEDLGLQVLEIRKNKLGYDHPDMIISMSNLAFTFSKQGRWEEAEELGLQVLEISKRKLGNDHPDTLIIMNNLAIMFSNRGRLGEAEELGLQVLEIRKNKLGENHPDTLLSMHTLAVTQCGLGRGEEAIALMSECVRRGQRHMPANHPYMDTFVRTLADLEAGK